MGLGKNAVKKLIKLKLSNSLIIRGSCKSLENALSVMLNLFQHLIKSMAYETLKQVQGDKIRTFARASYI
jgi:hypothetical protein